MKAEKQTKLVEILNDKVLTTSLKVADKFKKRHDHVLEKIRNLKCSKQFHSLHFRESIYLADNGKEEKLYLITEEGFMFVAMRFTGKDAVNWQEQFITSFQLMRKELLRIREQRLSIDWQESRANGKCIRNVLTSAVQCLERLADKQGGLKGKPENRHYYETTTKMIYKQLFGDSTLKNVRDKLDVLQLTFLSICEQACADEIKNLEELDIDYHDIYQECKKRVIETVEGLSASKLKTPGTVVKLAWDNG